MSEALCRLGRKKIYMLRRSNGWIFFPIGLKPSAHDNHTHLVVLNVSQLCRQHLWIWVFLSLVHWLRPPSQASEHQRVCLDLSPHAGTCQTTDWIGRYEIPYLFMFMLSMTNQLYVWGVTFVKSLAVFSDSLPHLGIQYNQQTHFMCFYWQNKLFHTG